MFQKLSVVLRRQVHPYGLLASCLVVLTLLTALSGMWHYQYELDHVSKPSSPSPIETYARSSTPKPSDQLAPAASSAALGATPQTGQTNKSSATTLATTNPKQTSQQATAVSPQNPPTPSPAFATVSLSVNGVRAGSVSLASSSNQCDVLTQALTAGLISNLDMRYNAQIKNYAVYVINSIGDHNAVAWIYTVNGALPDRGCFDIVVRDSDVVNWQYLKK